MRSHFLFLIIAILMVPGVAAAEIDRALAKQYFDEARAECTADAGRLWGTSLCGPMMFADPRTHEIVANQADAEGNLQKADGIFAGLLPKSINISNTSLDWAGVLWTQVMWPLPKDATARRMLLAHESFHRLQKTLNLNLRAEGGDSVDSLDTANGRYLLQLEWRALAKAVEASGGARRAFVEDALIFRQRRLEMFPAERERERMQQWNEGLAEYTGMKLASAGVAQERSIVLAGLAGGPKKASFVRSFAYVSGPAYGLLLDELSPEWRKNALREPVDLGELLRSSMKLTLPAKLAEAVEQRAAKYDGAALLASERTREQERAKRVAEYKALLVDGPVLRLPLVQAQFSFNPNSLQPIEGAGTAYPNLRISDAWGVLEAEKGALLSSDWQRATVAAPKSNAGGAGTIEGDGWKLELKSGWKLKPGPREGDYEIAKE